MFNWIRSVINAVTGFFGRLFSAEVNVVDNITGIVANYRTGRSQIEDGVERLKNFQFDPRWKTRVINVPIAIEAIVALYDEVFGDFKERLGQIIEPVHQLQLIFHADKEQAGLTEVPSGLSRTAVKIDEIATMIAQIKTATDTALTFTQAFDDIIINLETLDAIFLGQTNPRRVERLEDGDTIKIRLGNLHS